MAEPMKKEKKSEADSLRQKAEAMLKTKSPKISSQLPEAETARLIHELEVHQIELELQNEELSLAKERAELAVDKYTELYDFAPSGYFTLSQAGEIIALNLQSAHMLGKERAYLINRPFSFFISDMSKPIFNLFLQKVFSCKTTETCEITISSVADLMVYIHLSGIADKNREKCFITAVDITDGKQAEQELLKAKEHAEESDHLKSAFLANMSHEIRTPMNGVLGFADLLKDPKLSGEEQEKYVSIIQRSGTRLLNIINDIIDISKIEAGQMAANISETNVNEKIEDTYNFFKQLIKKKGIHFSYKNPLPSIQSIIKTDGEKLYAILTNLVNNAIKFTHSGSIEFGYIKRDGFLEFFVKDTGIGVSQAQKEIIFERFRQGNKPLTKNFEGTGLGLSISKAYVEMLGGKIRVESEEGQGSAFYFTIPYITEKQIQSNNPDILSAEEETGQIKNLKILIAEDDETSDFLITSMLSKNSHELIHATTGLETIEECRNNPNLDLVLMDIRFPDISGIEATQQIRQFNKSVIIIAQTAYALAGDRKRAIEAGCNDYMAKPINKDELETLIQKHIKNRKD